MKASSITWIAAVLILGPTLCYPQQAQPAGRGQQAAPAPPRDTSPQVLDVQGGKIRVVTVASGLFHPWGIAFADANTILVTERSGALLIIRNGVLAPQPVWTSPAPAAPPPGSTPPAAGQGNDRLHFVAVHPDFAQNRLVYVSYPKTGEKGSTLAVARGFLRATCSATSRRSSSPTRGRPEATSPAASSSARTRTSTSRSAIVIVSAATRATPSGRIG